MFRVPVRRPAFVAALASAMAAGVISTPVYASAAHAAIPIVRPAPPPTLPAALQPPAVPIVTPANAGYLPDAWEVTPDGAFTDAVPIDVPDGRAGMAPHLTLRYSSASGNGLFGMGWSLSGMSSQITRCGKTLSTEGTVAGIAYDQSDRYCLDGQKLIAVGGIDYGSGDYGGIDTQYRTESDMFAQIVSVGSDPTIASGPDAFIVRTTTGLVLTYLPHTASQPVTAVGFNPGPVGFAAPAATDRVVWLLDSEADRSGNAIRWTYTGTESIGDYRPDRITYTYNTGVLTGQRYVQFVYEDRPDPEVAYQVGVASTLAKRVKAIELYAPNPTATQLVWKYSLGYQTSSTQRSLLTSVTKCSPNGGCLKAKLFDWNNPQIMPWFTTSTFNPQPTAPNGFRTPAMKVMDLNGDGIDDILYELGGTSDADAPIYARLGHRDSVTGTVQPLSELYTATGNGLPANTSLTYSRPLDLGSDGRTEFAAKYLQGANWQDSIVSWNSANNTFTSAGVNVPAGANTDFGDVNGDGLADYLSTSSVQLNLGSGTFGAANPLPANGCDRRVTDVDGDGRAELVGVEQPNACSTNTYTLRVADNGTVTKHSETFGSNPVYYRVLPSSVPSYVTRTGDFNGDGLADTLILPTDPKVGVIIAWNTGTGLRLDTHWLSIPRDQYADVRIADFNGDGRDDIMSLNLTSITVMMGLGDGTFVKGTVANDSGTLSNGAGRPTTQIGDFNGDGRPDIVRVVNGALTLMTQSSLVAPDRVIGVRDEGTVWTRTSVGYSTMWTDHPEKITQSVCSYPMLCVRRGIIVAREVDSRAHNVDVTAANATAYVTKYSYEDPVVDLRGRGSLGFGVFRVWDPQRPQETVTTFAHRTRTADGFYPEVGRPSTVTTTTPLLTLAQVAGQPTSANARVTQTHYGYETRSLNGGKNRAVFTANSTTKTWEQIVSIAWGTLGGPGGSSQTEHLAGIYVPDNPPSRADDQWVHDDYGNITHEISAVTFGVTTTIDTAYDVRVDDWLVALPTVRTETRTEASGGYAPVTRTTENHYDAAGRVDTLYVEKGNADPGVVSTTTYAYDNYGVVRKITGSAPGQADRVVHLEYTPLIAGQPDEEVYPSQVWSEHTPLAYRPSLWQIVQPAYGVVIASEDVNGVVSTATYDAFGRTVTEKPAGAAPVTYAYAARTDAGGGTNGVLATTIVDGRTSVRVTDGLGRAIQQTSTGFDGSTISVDTTYDLLGRMSKQTRPHLGVVASGSSSFGYDSLDRLTKTTGPNGAVSSAIYQMFTTQATDADGHETDTIDDVNGRIITSTRVLTDPGKPVQLVSTAYEYAPFGLLGKVTDPTGHKTTFAYDTLGRRTSMNEPDRGTTTDVYYGMGDTESETHQATGVSTTYTYDDLGRLVSTLDGDGTTTFSWDSAAHGIGKLAATLSTDGIGTAYRYDTNGNRVGADYIDQSTGTTYSMDRQFGPTGRLLSTSFPDLAGNSQFSLGYTYNAYGYLSQVSSSVAGGSSTPLWTVNTRNADMTLATASFGTNQLALSRTPDIKTGQLQHLTVTAGAAKLLDLGYGYTAGGQVNARTEHDVSADRNEAYGYDSLDRLTSWTLATGAKNPVTTGYSYDKLGNLTALTQGASADTRTFGAAGPHQLSNRDATALGGPLQSDTYDGGGREIKVTQGTDMVQRATTYTAKNLPKSMTVGGDTYTFAYDAFGQRVRKTGPDGTTFTVPGAYERRTAGNTDTYVYQVDAGDGPIAQVTDDGVTSTTAFLLTDALGSLDAVSDGTSVTHAYFYDPFGTRIAADGSAAADTPGAEKPIFAGQQADEDLGLIDMKGRLYDPQTQRFTTPDPVVGDANNGQAWNPYSYVLNNPLNYTDPTGYIYMESCQSTPYMPECSGNGANDPNGYDQSVFNPSLGDKDGGWGAREFQRDMAEFFGAAEAYESGGAHGLADYERGDLGREVGALEAEWGPGGYMAQAAALAAAKSDKERYQAAGHAAYQAAAAAHGDGSAPAPESEADKKAREESLAVKGGCGDWSTVSGSSLAVQICSYYNKDISWAEVHWYNFGPDTEYLGQIEMYKLTDNDALRPSDTSCGATAVGPGEGGSCNSDIGRFTDGWYAKTPIYSKYFDEYTPDALWSRHRGFDWSDPDEWWQHPHF